IISRYLSWHGSTLGSLSASGLKARKTVNEPLAPGFIHVHPPTCYRCPFGKSYIPAGKRGLALSEPPESPPTQAETPATQDPRPGPRFPNPTAAPRGGEKGGLALPEMPQSVAPQPETAATQHQRACPPFSPPLDATGCGITCATIIEQVIQHEDPATVAA